ncbi:Protein CBG15354 [Caenorhabditis briggsae]|uniref:Protein CBG15354 n=1 Tax=Caenorhabditis briggsae TaxID=6238 RepID=H8WH26_CAEBR|nr:Protein CBG15354 [Caenorhabditis briggsae]CCG58547.1 Protein CBG15354 [Caenorhabditis briggsae]
MFSSDEEISLEPTVRYSSSWNPTSSGNFREYSSNEDIMIPSTSSLSNDSCNTATAFNKQSQAFSRIPRKKSSSFVEEAEKLPKVVLKSPKKSTSKKEDMIVYQSNIDCIRKGETTDGNQYRACFYKFNATVNANPNKFCDATESFIGCIGDFFTQECNPYVGWMQCELERIGFAYDCYGLKC